MECNLAKGATSLTEAWDAEGDSTAASQNHFMLGQIQEWFYHDLAGIQNDPANAGFKKIIINPQPVGDVTWVKAGYDSIHGKIVRRLETRRWKIHAERDDSCKHHGHRFLSPAEISGGSFGERQAGGAKQRRKILAAGKRSCHF